MHPAMAARLNKIDHPERYCPKCLWNLRSGPCPKHQKAGHTLNHWPDMPLLEKLKPGEVDPRD